MLTPVIRDAWLIARAAIGGTRTDAETEPCHGLNVMIGPCSRRSQIPADRPIWLRPTAPECHEALGVPQPAIATAASNTAALPTLAADRNKCPGCAPQRG